MELYENEKYRPENLLSELTEPYFLKILPASEIEKRLPRFINACHEELEGMRKAMELKKSIKWGAHAFSLSLLAEDLGAFRLSILLGIANSERNNEDVEKDSLLNEIWREARKIIEALEERRVGS